MEFSLKEILWLLTYNRNGPGWNGERDRSGHDEYLSRDLADHRIMAIEVSADHR